MFRLSSKARTYFEKINENSTTGKFETIWDYYYLCLMIGFRRGELGDEVGSDYEFTKDFPKPYNSKKYQIIASLVLSEMNRQGIPKNDSEDIRKLMLELLDKDAVTKISNEGLKRMNRYAEKGFAVLHEKIPPMKEMDTFLKRYHKEFIEIDY